MGKNEFIEVVTTVEDVAAGESLATLLVEKRLAACVQISGPITSVYRWQDEVEQVKEYQLLVKSRQDLFVQVQAVIAEHHSYDVPQIIALPISAGSESYLRWLAAELGGNYD